LAGEDGGMTVKTSSGRSPEAVADNADGMARLGPDRIRSSSRLRCRTSSWQLAVLLPAVLGSPCLGQWPYQQQWGLFHVHADFSPDRVRSLFSELDMLQRDLQEQLRIGPMQEHVDVYLFAQREVYHNYMRHYFPQMGVRQAMYIKSNSPGNVFAYLGPEFAIDLRHEATHAMLHAMLPLLPLWLDEGLAEYFEVTAEQRRDGNPYLRTVVRDAHLNRSPSLVQLEALRDLSEFGPPEYRDAWAYVHFLLHGPPAARQVLWGYLADIRGHRPPRPISGMLDESLADPRAALIEHFRNWRR
jgi:hypothetical protein